MLVTARNPLARLVFVVASTLPVPGRCIAIAIIVMSTAARILIKAIHRQLIRILKRMIAGNDTCERKPGNLSQGSGKCKDEGNHQTNNTKHD